MSCQLVKWASEWHVNANVNCVISVISMTLTSAMFFCSGDIKIFPHIHFLCLCICVRHRRMIVELVFAHLACSASLTSGVATWLDFTFLTATRIFMESFLQESDEDLCHILLILSGFVRFFSNVKQNYLSNIMLSPDLDRIQRFVKITIDDDWSHFLIYFSCRFVVSIQSRAHLFGEMFTTFYIFFDLLWLSSLHWESEYSYNRIHTENDDHFNLHQETKQKLTNLRVYFYVASEWPLLG